jgi:hypothetical protein
VSRATKDFEVAALDLDAHLDECASCSAGRACADGDDYAEAEYRAYAELCRSDPREASQWVRRYGR